MNSLTASDRCLHITMEAEDAAGPHLVAYWDADGKVWTIGWGHTGPDVHEGLNWTYQQCVDGLRHDIGFAEHAVNRFVTATLNQNQFDALVDFVFNEGSGTFQTSTLLRLVNNSQFQAAAEQFQRFKYAGGKVLNGLVTRRAKEKELFISP